MTHNSGNKKLQDKNTRKRMGVYYTPQPLADAIVKSLKNISFRTVLEPSCGDGAFLRAIAAADRITDVLLLDAVEINETTADKVQTAYADNRAVNVINEDFLEYHARLAEARTVPQYDLVIGNPPYIRNRYLTDRQKQLADSILNSYGLPSDHLCNLFCIFTVACAHMVANTGMLVFVLPAEIMNAGYSGKLRKHLMQVFDEITIVTFGNIVFHEIQQEVVVLYCRKGTGNNRFRILVVESPSELVDSVCSDQAYASLPATERKWETPSLDISENHLLDRIRIDDRFVPLTSFGRINVGVTTGNNDFFTVDDETCNEYQLKNVTLPLIRKGSSTHGIRYTDTDWKAEAEQGRKSRLVCFPDIPFDEYSAGQKRYIEEGERRGEFVGYKCSVRKRWYIVPSVWIPDMFFTRRIDGYARLIANKCGAVSTDGMNRLALNPEVDSDDLLLSFYNSVTFAFIESAGRRFGGGVLEIRPAEMQNVFVPRRTGLDKDRRTVLLDQIDDMMRKGDDIEKILDLVDDEVLVKSLGIEKDLCIRCRNIWHSLQTKSTTHTLEVRGLPEGDPWGH